MAINVRWAVLGTDGEVTKGSGPEKGLPDLLRSAKACAVIVAGLPPLVVAGGPDLLWTVEKDVFNGRFEKRWWGFAPPEGHRVWLWPDNSMIGIGPEIEDVIAAWDKIRG